jgi:hypothetical protein
VLVLLMVLGVLGERQQLVGALAQRVDVAVLAAAPVAAAVACHAPSEERAARLFAYVYAS